MAHGDSKTRQRTRFACQHTGEVNSDGHIRIKMHDGRSIAGALLKVGDLVKVVRKTTGEFRFIARVASIEVVDCCIVGDWYTVHVDGRAIGTTPTVPHLGPTPSSGTSGLRSDPHKSLQVFRSLSGSPVRQSLCPPPRVWGRRRTQLGER